jgi:hypothetical protein
VDLTGNWVSLASEEWRWRMTTPPRGDYISLPLSDEGRRVADTWTPALDGSCKAYGAGGVMWLPTRLRVSWEGDQALKVETDAGQQTRLLRFANPGAAAPKSPPARPVPPAQRSWQGESVAEWTGGGAGNIDPFTGRGDGPGAQRWGALKVRTTNMRPGWLRRNGVPYSDQTVVTEYFTRFTHPQAGDWFVVTTTVEDPTYLTGPFITSSNFKKEADGSKFKPVACRK